MDGRARSTQEWAESIGTIARASPSGQDLGLGGLAESVGRALRARSSVSQACHSFGPIATHPLVAGGSADAELVGDMSNGPALTEDSSDEKLATEDGQLRLSMCHESSSSIWSFRHPKPSTRALTLSTTCVGTTSNQREVAAEALWDAARNPQGYVRGAAYRILRARSLGERLEVDFLAMADSDARLAEHATDDVRSWLHHGAASALRLAAASGPVETRLDRREVAQLRFHLGCAQGLRGERRAAEPTLIQGLSETRGLAPCRSFSGVRSVDRRSPSERTLVSLPRAGLILTPGQSQPTSRAWT